MQIYFFIKNVRNLKWKKLNIFYIEDLLEKYCNTNFLIISCLFYLFVCYVFSVWKMNKNLFFLKKVGSTCDRSFSFFGVIIVMERKIDSPSRRKVQTCKLAHKKRNPEAKNQKNDFPPSTGTTTPCIRSRDG